MEVTQEHVSAGCNRVVGALDWGDSLVAYAAHNLVVVYDAEVSDPYHCDSCSQVQHGTWAFVSFAVSMQRATCMYTLFSVRLCTKDDTC